MKRLIILIFLFCCSNVLMACSSSTSTNNIQVETVEQSFVQITFEQGSTTNCVDIPAEQALMEKCGLDEDCYAAFS